MASVQAAAILRYGRHPLEVRRAAACRIRKRKVLDSGTGQRPVEGAQPSLQRGGDQAAASQPLIDGEEVAEEFADVSVLVLSLCG